MVSHRRGVSPRRTVFGGLARARSAALIVEKGVSVVLLNKISIRSVGALGSLLVFAAASNAVLLPPTKSSDSGAVEQGRKLLADRSARFVENKGQWKPEGRFLAQSRNLNLWYTDRGIRFDQISPNLSRHQAIDMVFVGGKSSRPVGTSKLNAESQYFHGSTAIRGVGSYREIVKRGVLPGVDMRAYFEGGKPRYDLIVAPGANASAIALGFQGSNGLSLSKGALKIGTNFGGIFNSKPTAYQMVDGKRVLVPAAWKVEGSHAGFKLGSYDTHRPLVIDPLVYGTYFGGLDGPDEVRAAVTDTYGGVNRGLFIAGSSASADYPGTSLPFGDTLNPAAGSTDAFVARIPTAGTYTDLSIFIGGNGTDIAQYVKRNPLNGDIWIAGTTVAATTRNGTTNQFNNFPVSLNAAGTGNLIIGDDVSGGADFFVGRFTHLADGSLTYGDASTTSANPRYAAVFGTGIASAATRSAFITGFDINPTADGTVQMAFSGVSDSALAPTSNALLYNSGTQASGYAFPTNASGAAHRSGFLLRFVVNPTGNTAQSNAFIVSRNSSQYVSGTRRNEVRGVALDSSGNAYVVGTVYQPDNPTTADPLNVDTSQSQSSAIFYTTANAISDTNGTTVLGRLLRATDVFVRIYGPFNQLVGQNNILFSGLVGGNGDDEAGGVACSLSVITNTGVSAQPESFIPIYTGSAIAIDADANIYFTGTTRAAPNFPHTAGAFGGFTPPLGAEQIQSDIFVARLSTGGTRLDYAATLNANARQLPDLSSNQVSIDSNYGPANFTTAMPAGIAVDSRGYVYITGNLRAYDIVFPSTYTTAGSPDEPTSSTLSSIPVGQAANTIDTTYDTTGTGNFPTTEGFLAVFDPKFASLQFASYIGGNLDDLVYAPNFDADGNVLVSGWTDGARVYVAPYKDPSSQYIAVGGGVPGYISGTTLRSVQDSNANLSIPQFGWEIFGTQTSAFAFDQQAIPGTSTPASSTAIQGFISVGRDGFVASVSPNLPAAVAPSVSLAFNPATIAPLGTSTGTVTLNAAQPLTTRVRVVLSSIGTLSPSDITLTGPNDPAGQLTYVNIPSGQTTGSFTVKSNTVGSGGTLTFGASLSNGSSSSAGLTISATTFSLSLNPMTVVGSTAGTSVTGTLNLPTAVATDLNFVMTVPNTAANQTIFNVGTSNAFATVDSSDPTKLDIATATIPANSTSGTFTFKVSSPSAPTVLVVTASTVANSVVSKLTATSSLTVNPVGLVSITPRLSTIRSGRDQLVLTVVFDGPVSSSDAFSLSYSLGGVFPPTTSTAPTLNTTIGALSFSGINSSGQYVYTYTANSNRVTRSQDVNILATYRGTTASTTVAVVR